jgi:PAS domain S-box-containing protein
VKARGFEVGERLAHLEEVNRALRKRLEHFENAAKGVSEGLWDWDVESNEFFASGTWKEMLGIPAREEIANDIWITLLHEEDRNRAIQYFQDFIEGKVDNYNQQYRLMHRNGEYRWILSKATATRGKNGVARRVSGSHTDISDKKHAERTERKYHNLFQNTLVAMGSMTSDLSCVLDANEKFWAYLEIQRSERHNFRPFDVLSKKQRNDFLHQIAENGSVENFEFQIKKEGNPDKWALINAVFYPDEDVIDFVLKDITQTKENLIELQKVNFELDSFVYHASHDLRSPLRSILGLIDLYNLEEDAKLREECIEKIGQSVKRLDDLVVELLSISRNDRVNDPHSEINLMLEVNNSISSYYNATDTTNLEVSTQILQPVPFVSDPTRVRIILNNVISNAIKYRSFRKEKSTIDIFAEVNEDHALIRISDNGEGIEESKLPHIFDMFYRATERSEGSGLGLYIVKKVADKLNASIDVSSEELEGTTFTVKIPNSK